MVYVPPLLLGLNEPSGLTLNLLSIVLFPAAAALGLLFVVDEAVSLLLVTTPL